MDLVAFARRLRDAREYLGLTQEEVARHMGWSRSSVSALENGQRHLSTGELTRMAELYQRSVSSLLDESEEARALDTLDEQMRGLHQVWPYLDEKDRLTVLRFARFLHSAGRVPLTDG